MKFGVLWVTTADGAVQDYPLDLPALLIGRAGGNNIVVDDLSIARRHARLAFDSGRLMVEDLGSAEGTFINGERIPPYTPSLVESGEEVRLGGVSLRFQAPASQAVDQLLPLPFGIPRAEEPEEDLPVAEPAPGVRAFFAAQPAPVEPGTAASVATLTVQNRGQVVDELALGVAGVPEEWVRISNPRVVLLPGDSVGVPIIVAPPREPNSRAGDYDFSITVTSGETGREVLAPCRVTILPYRELALTLHPARAKRRFDMEAVNRGNAPAVYALSGTDDEETFSYQFPVARLELAPGEQRRYQVAVRRPGPPAWRPNVGLGALVLAALLAVFAVVETPWQPARDPVRLAMLGGASGLLLLAIGAISSGRRLFGHMEIHPFRVAATPAGGGEKTFAEGQLLTKPPVQPFVFPAIVTAVLGVLGFCAFVWYAGPPAWLPDGPGIFKKEVTTALAAGDDPEARYAGVHNCETGKEPKPLTVSDSLAPFFKQNDEAWAQATYARADDAEFAKERTCGTTIGQCGSELTALVSILNVFEILTLPDGKELTPATLNEWLGKDAQKTGRGWVSDGYAYGDVLWMGVNQLSAEWRQARPDARAVRYVRTTEYNAAVARSELRAGRPLIVEFPGHYVAAVNVDGDRILINDPYYKGRKSLDDYEDAKPLSMALFEVSNDLGGVVVVAPRDMRVQVRSSAEQFVGTLKVGTEQEVLQTVQRGIQGASYMDRPALRDPSCVESPPPTGSGTVQIVLPGTREDYTIDVLNSNGGATSAVIYSYDSRGTVTTQLVGREGPAQVSLKYDPSQASPPPAVVVAGQTPAAGGTPQGGATTPGTSQPGSGTPSGGATPAPGATSSPSPGASATVTAGASPTGSPTGTATARPTVVPTPTPLPPAPAAVGVACTVAYQADPNVATVTCNATIDGTFTNVGWAVNGVFVPQAAGKATYTTTFTGNTNLTVSANACNLQACRTGSSGVEVRFPAPGVTPTATPGANVTPTPTPAVRPSAPDLTCGIPNGRGEVTCTVQFSGQHTRVTFEAPGASPASQDLGITDFDAVVPAETTTFVTATVCNFDVCSSPTTVQVEGGPRAVVQITVPPSGSSCQLPFTVTVGGVLGPAPGTVTFLVNGTDASGEVALSGGTASYSPPPSVMAPGSTYNVRWRYNGHLTSRYRVNDSNTVTKSCP